MASFGEREELESDPDEKKVVVPMLCVGDFGSNSLCVASSRLREKEEEDMKSLLLESGFDGARVEESSSSELVSSLCVPSSPRSP